MEVLSSAQNVRLTALTLYIDSDIEMGSSLILSSERLKPYLLFESFTLQPTKPAATEFSTESRKPWNAFPVISFGQPLRPLFLYIDMPGGFEIVVNSIRGYTRGICTTHKETLELLFCSSP